MTSIREYLFISNGNDYDSQDALREYRPRDGFLGQKVILDTDTCSTLFFERMENDLIGGLLGIGLAIAYLGSAWSGETGTGVYDSGLIQGLIILFGSLLIGLFLFPRTVGMAFTPPIFITPVAFIIGFARHGFTFGLSMLILGIGSWLVTFIVSRLRPSSAY